MNTKVSFSKKKSKKLASYIQRTLLTHWSFRHVKNKKNEHFFYDRRKCLGKGAFASVYAAYKVKIIDDEDGEDDEKLIKYTYKNSAPLVAKVSLQTFSKYAKKQSHTTSRELSEQYELWENEAITQTEYIPTHAAQHKKNGRYTIISDFIPGENVDTLLSKRKNQIFTLQQSVKLTTQILALVNHIHQSGIVHTDIKLENMLLQMRLNTKEQINIIDYGFATPINNTFGLSYVCQEPNGIQAGTPQYFAAEGLMDLTTRARDIYALTPLLFYFFGADKPLKDKDAATKKAIMEGREDDALRDTTQANYNSHGLFRGHLIPKSLAFTKPLIKTLLNGMQASSPGDRPDADLLLRFFSKLELLVDITYLEETPEKEKNKLKERRKALEEQRNLLIKMKTKDSASLAWYKKALRKETAKITQEKYNKQADLYNYDYLRYKKKKKQCKNNPGQYNKDKTSYKADLTQMVNNYLATRLLHPKRALNKHYKTYITPYFEADYKEPPNTKTKTTVIRNFIALYKNNKTYITCEKNELEKFVNKLKAFKKGSLSIYGHCLKSLKENIPSPTDTPLKKFLLLLRENGYTSSTDITQRTPEALKKMLALYNNNKEKILDESKHDLPTIKDWACIAFCATSKKPGANEANKQIFATIAIDGASTFNELIQRDDHQTPLITLLMLYLAPPLSKVSVKNKFDAIMYCTRKKISRALYPKDIIKFAIRLLRDGLNIKLDDREILCGLIIESKQTSFDELYNLYNKEKIAPEYKAACIKKLDENKLKADEKSPAKNKVVSDKKAYQSIRRWARTLLSSATNKDDQDELARIATEGASPKELARAYKKNTSTILKQCIVKKLKSNPTYVSLFTRAKKTKMPWYKKLYHAIMDAIKFIPNPTYKKVKWVAKQEASVTQSSTLENPEPVASPTSSSTSKMTDDLKDTHKAKSGPPQGDQNKVENKQAKKNRRFSYATPHFHRPLKKTTKISENKRRNSFLV